MKRIGQQVLLFWALILFITLIIVGICLGLRDAQGETIIVAKDGSGDYTRIASGIGAAKKGDDVYVKAGVYQENIEILKEITVTGEDKFNVTIDGGGNDNVVLIQGGNVKFSDFTVKNSGTG